MKKTINVGQTIVLETGKVRIGTKNNMVYSSHRSEPLEVEVTVEVYDSMMPVPNPHRLGDVDQLPTHHISYVAQGPVTSDFSERNQNSNRLRTSFR